MQRVRWCVVSGLAACVGLAACDVQGFGLPVSPLRLTEAVVPATARPVPSLLVATATPVPSSTTYSVSPVTPTPADGGVQVGDAAASASATPAAVQLTPGPSGLVPAPNGTGSLHGTVYDQAGVALSGVTLTVRSLDGALGYLDHAGADQGFFSLSNVPIGVNLEVTAARAGWTSRRRTLALATADTALAFGGKDDPYFLSPHPEVVSASLHKQPGDNRLGLTVTLSEGLDASNQNRFAQALRLVPANEAAGSVTPGDLSHQILASGQAIDEGTQGLIRAGTTFQDDGRAAVSWDATGTIATLDFDGRLLRTGGGALYQVVLVSGGGAVVDGDGNALGMTPDNLWLGADGSPGTIWRRAFLNDPPVLDPGVTSPEERWASTHGNVLLVDPSTAYSN